jgi:hypothetical protein
VVSVTAAGPRFVPLDFRVLPLPIAAPEFESDARSEVREIVDLQLDDGWHLLADEYQYFKIDGRRYERFVLMRVQP